MRERKFQIFYGYKMSSRNALLIIKFVAVFYSLYHPFLIPINNSLYKQVFTYRGTQFACFMVR